MRLCVEFTAMDAQTQDSSVCVSDEQQLTAPPGWTKKLVPASAKSITLRKHDVIFIAPDGQEVRSKWHLNRYLKAHPGGPALLEFNWSSGEEAPIRRSSRFATKEASEDNKSTSRKKGKRNASEMDAEEAKNDQEKAPAKKRAKKPGKPVGSDEKSDVEDAADVSEKDEVMHEAAACDNEATQDDILCDQVQRDESNNENLMEVETSKEAVTEKTADEGLDKQVEAEESNNENLMEVEASKEAVSEKTANEGLDKQVEAEEAVVSSATTEGEHEKTEVKVVSSATIEGEHERTEVEVVSSATIEGEHENTEVKVVEVEGSCTDNELHVENDLNAAQEIGALIDPSDDFKVEEVAVESEKPPEHVEHVKVVSSATIEGEHETTEVKVVEVEGSFTDNELHVENDLNAAQEIGALVDPSDDFKVEEVAVESEKPPEHADGEVMMLQGQLDEKLEENKGVSSNVTTEKSVIEVPADSNDKPLEPLMQKEEQERLNHFQNSPLKVENSKERSPSEFGSSSVPVNVANE